LSLALGLVPVPLVAPDAADRAADAHLPPPGYAVRLTIPAIKLDTPVKQGGIVQDKDGTPIWQTLPFVAVHYGDLTALVGARGNAVIAGHVVTLSEGNVFRFLYQLDLDDQIQVWDDHDREHDFRVTDVKLVPPEDTSVMAQTPDPTLTLITCGGTFDPQRREFSARLIVTAKPL
jgi:LPXTG-site transpeptidase (sortase) family protein